MQFPWSESQGSRRTDDLAVEAFSNAQTGRVAGVSIHVDDLQPDTDQ